MYSFFSSSLELRLKNTSSLECPYRTMIEFHHPFWITMERRLWRCFFLCLSYSIHVNKRDNKMIETWRYHYDWCMKVTAFYTFLSFFSYKYHELNACYLHLWRVLFMFFFILSRLLFVPVTVIDEEKKIRI